MRCLSQVLRLIVVALLLLTGCLPTPGTPPPPQAKTGEVKAGQRLVADQSTPAQAAPQDAPEAVGIVIQFEIWELHVPYGTVSRNEDFWKRINENVVDVETADRMWRNGVRIGEAPIDEWPYFKGIIEQNPARSRQQVHMAREAKTIELPARGEQRWQDLFFFDSTDRMIGRTFEECENLFTLAFEPAPRRPGTVRMVLCPVVRATRRHLEFVGQRENKTVQYVQAKRLFDLNLRTDIPLDSFLVVAPSSEARIPTSIGANFLTLDGPAERLERVYLFVPRPFVLPSQP
jgi:hypothetical protein